MAFDCLDVKADALVAGLTEVQRASRTLLYDA